MERETRNSPEAAAAGAGQPSIELSGLTRRFGDFTAVDGISLSIPHGSFFGFLGPNGAGKTTTLRMITGLLPPSAGETRIEGRSLTTDGVAIKQRIGVVPDELALFDRLSIWEHLTMMGRIFGLSPDETGRRAEDLLRLLDIWNERGSFAVDCSHGMRKKLALAMALIHNPALLFLDEPFEGIDPLASRQIRALLTDLAHRGVTIFLTSHILEIVERLADRVAIIVKGRIALDSSLADLHAAGRSLEDAFVAAAGGPDDNMPELSWLG